MQISTYDSAEDAINSLNLGKHLDRRLVRQVCMDWTKKFNLSRLGGVTTAHYLHTLFENMLDSPFGKSTIVGQQSESRNLVVFSDVYHPPQAITTLMRQCVNAGYTVKSFQKTYTPTNDKTPPYNTQRYYPNENKTIDIEHTRSGYIYRGILYGFTLCPPKDVICDADKLVAEDMLQIIPEPCETVFGSYTLTPEYRAAMYKYCPDFIVDEIVATFLGYSPSFPSQVQWYKHRVSDRTIAIITTLSYSKFLTITANIDKEDEDLMRNIVSEDQKFHEDTDVAATKILSIIQKHLANHNILVLGFKCLMILISYGKCASLFEPSEDSKQSRLLTTMTTLFKSQHCDPWLPYHIEEFVYFVHDVSWRDSGSDTEGIETRRTRLRILGKVKDLASDFIESFTSSKAQELEDVQQELHEDCTPDEFHTWTNRLRSIIDRIPLQIKWKRSILNRLNTIGSQILGIMQTCGVSTDTTLNCIPFLLILIDNHEGTVYEGESLIDETCSALEYMRGVTSPNAVTPTQLKDLANAIKSTSLRELEVLYEVIGGKNSPYVRILYDLSKVNDVVKRIRAMSVQTIQKKRPLPGDQKSLRKPGKKLKTTSRR